MKIEKKIISRPNSSEQKILDDSENFLKLEQK